MATPEDVGKVRGPPFSPPCVPRPPRAGARAEGRREGVAGRGPPGAGTGLGRSPSLPGRAAPPAGRPRPLLWPPAPGREGCGPGPSSTGWRRRAPREERDTESGGLTTDPSPPFPFRGAQAFVQHYYTTFAGNRPALQSLYQEHSMLTWEGKQFAGAAAIIQHLSGLPFKSVQHQVSTLDVQPSMLVQGANGSSIVAVTGQLLLEGEQHPLKFSQTFHLVPSGQPGQFFVLNDIFR